MARQYQERRRRDGANPSRSRGTSSRRSTSRQPSSRKASPRRDSTTRARPSTRPTSRGRAAYEREPRRVRDASRSRGGRSSARSDAQKGWSPTVVIIMVAIFAVVGISSVLVWNGVASRKAREQQGAQSSSSQVVEKEDPKAQSLDRAKKVVDGLTLEQKVAQLFVVRPEALTNVDAVTEAGSTTREAIADYPVGGFLYSSKNIIDEKQVKSLLKNTQNYVKDASGLPAFMCIEEEGGTQAPLAKAYAGVKEVSNAAGIGASNSAEEARDAARQIGGDLRSLGFNLNLAPVADIVSSVDSDLSERSFGEDPQKVATMVEAQIDGYSRAGIACAAKHFPGSGEAQKDPHNDRFYSHRKEDELAQRETIPFAKAVEANVPAMVVSNMSCLEIGNGEGDVPAWMSKTIVQGMLRDDMGFDGVAMTDLLDEKSVSYACDVSEQGVRALQAGMDLVVCPKSFERAYMGILSAVEDGEITEDRINESVLRIVMLKQSLTD